MATVSGPTSIPTTVWQPMDADDMAWVALDELREAVLRANRGDRVRSLKAAQAWLEMAIRQAEAEMRRVSA